MANVLNTDKQIAISQHLAKVQHPIHRTHDGVHRDTIMRLGVKVGLGCTALLDAKMRDLSCNRLEIDEIWGFVARKRSTSIVEVFDLKGHPKHRGSTHGRMTGSSRHGASLGTYQIAADAVRAAIAQEFRSLETETQESGRPNCRREAPRARCCEFA